MPASAPPRTRQPTGKPGWPRILLSGAEGTWKSGTAALLSADDRLGEMFWLEVGDGETTADEYGSLPGVRYTILDHDGTWLDIYNQLDAAWHVAKEAEEQGQPPMPLAIDAMSGIWSMLMELGDVRAREKAAREFAKDHKDTAVAWSADYEATMTPDLWGLVRKRHNQLMTKILTWPGPVVLISREKVATVFENGQPTKQKDWSLECNKNLPGQITAWVRLEGNGVGRIRKLRSAKLATAVDLNERDRRVSDFSLSTLIFDWVGCEVGVSRAARVVKLDANQDMPDEVTIVGDGAPQRPAQLTPDELAERRARARKVVQWALESGDVDTAAQRATALMNHRAKDSDILPVLSEEERELLGVSGPDVARLTLAELGPKIVDYVSDHKCSVLAPLDEPVAPDAEPTAEPAAEASS
jgi:hypothetical protein